MSKFIKFYFASSMLNMFRTLIHTSSGAWDFSIVSPHWLCVLVSMCVGVLVWLGWGGIRVAGFIHQGYMATEYKDGKTKTLTPRMVCTLGKYCIKLCTVRRIPAKGRK